MLAPKPSAAGGLGLLFEVELWRSDLLTSVLELDASGNLQGGGLANPLSPPGALGMGSTLIHPFPVQGLDPRHVPFLESSRSPHAAWVTLMEIVIREHTSAKCLQPSCSLTAPPPAISP